MMFQPPSPGIPDIHRVARLAIAILVTLLAPGTQSAGAESDHGLAAIGRLNLAGYRHRRQCTATLVTPTVALTAKHCLRAFTTPGMVKPATVHLLLGYSQGKWLEHHRVSAFVIPNLPRANADVVLLRLTTASSIRPLKISGREIATGSKVVQAGYGIDRAHVLSVDDDCRFIDQLADGRWRHDCDTTFGESGAPILTPVGESWRVVAIISGYVKNFKLAEPVQGIGALAD